MEGLDIPHDKQSAHRYEILHSSNHDSFLPSNTGLPPCWERPVVLTLVLHICMVPMSKRRMRQPGMWGHGMSPKSHHFLSKIRKAALGHTKHASESLLHFLLMTEGIRQTI